MMLFMFEVEKAFWFFLDFWREHDTSLPSLNMKDFSRLLFNHCAMLHPYVGRLDAILAEWQVRAVPWCSVLSQTWPTSRITDRLQCRPGVPRADVGAGGRPAAVPQLS